MKKPISALLCLLIALTLCACGAEPEHSGPGESRTGSADASARYASIDIDVAALGSAMAYPEVYCMLSSPEEYSGKVVRIRGLFNVYTGTERNYYSCVVLDATACCVEEIEFVPAGDPAYPEDFPAMEEEITVVGVFDTYVKDDWTYCQLIDAEFSF